MGKHKERISIRIDHDLMELLRETAKKHHTTYTKIITKGSKKLMMQINKKPAIWKDILVNNIKDIT